MHITFSENNTNLVLGAVAQSLNWLATRWTVRILLPVLAQMVLCTTAFTWLIVRSELTVFRKWYRGKGTVVHVHVIEAYRGRRNSSTHSWIRR